MGALGAGGERLRQYRHGLPGRGNGLDAVLLLMSSSEQRLLSVDAGEWKDVQQ